jgi:hypothetical protein
MAGVSRRVALAGGVICLALGVVGFLASGVSTSAVVMLKLFKVNIVMAALRGLLGVWGIVSVFRESWAELWTRVAGIVFTILALTGLFLPDGFGYVPMGEHNLWLNGLMALVFLFVGYRRELAQEPIDWEEEA